MRTAALVLALLAIGACCRLNEAADRDAMRRGVCWQLAALTAPAPVDCYGDPLTGDRLAQRLALVRETKARMGIDCTNFAP